MHDDEGKQHEHAEGHEGVGVGAVAAAKPKKKKQKGIDAWVAKGWNPLHLTAGATASDQIALDPTTQDLDVLGQVFGGDGKPLHGQSRPHARVTETTDGAVVSFSSPLTQDVTLLYKIEDAGEEDAENFDEQQM